ncbi:MAG: nucleoside-diphosphate sugar epimerase/dehydratase [bacterium]|nr:nucleoside-diphosphate sugar epimerase/dehydratase [bacterium]
MSNFGFNILKPLSDRTTPRWIILLIDLLIVALSYTITTLSGSFESTIGGPYDLLRNYIILVGVFMIVSFFTKSYAYIIRLSALNDLFRTLSLCAISMIILSTINIAVQQITQKALISMWELSFVVLLAMCMMIAERLIAKYIYARITAISHHNQRVLVVGSSMRSVMIANWLQQDLNGRYTPVGLLSFKQQTNGRTSKNNYPVYFFSPETFDNIVETLNVSALIVDRKNLGVLRSEAATKILDSGIKVFTLNHIEDIDLTESNDTATNFAPQIRNVEIEDLLCRAPIITDNTLVRQNIYGRTVLITGACGSIGSELVRQVAACKAKLVVCVDQAETPMHDLMLEMKQSFPEIPIICFIGSVQNKTRMEQAFNLYRPTLVIHAAAYKHVPMMEINPTEAIINNVYGSKIIADLAVEYGVNKFVMVSTDKAVNPTNVMGATKRLAEIYTQSLFFENKKRGLQTQFITTRFGNVLGSNGSVIPIFRRQIESGGPVTITHKDIIRYFMTINEACSLVLEAGCMGNGGEIYVFDMGKPVKIYDLAAKMISLAGFRPGKDIKIVETGLRPGEKLYEELLNDKETTTATINEKIMIATVTKYDYEQVESAINEIIALAASGNTHEMIKAMKLFIPEYRSNNSEFETIDREIEDNGK